MAYVTIQGVRVPALGLGTWRPTGRGCEHAVAEAIDIGYRHIDTAQMYGNEAAVGAAIAASGVGPSELFVTTKLSSRAPRRGGRLVSPTRAVSPAGLTPRQRDSRRAMSIQLTSPAFQDGETIPDRYARLGDNVSPPLTWDGTPEGTVEQALLVQDPDAPSGTFTHWMVTRLGPQVDRLDEGQLPPRAVEGGNDFGEDGYGGPQPPPGDPPHRYVFTLLALDGSTDLEPGASVEDFHNAVQGKEIARGQLTGRYARGT